jgi:uncharacterized protein (DUF1330 family)
MKTKYKVAIALVAGTAIGGAAIQGLNAQTKPPTYVVIHIDEITDAATFNTLIPKAGPDTLAPFGGHYVIRTVKTTSLDGTAPQRFVVLAFDSVEKAQAWHNSPGTQEVDAIRAKSTKSHSFIVEGM